MECKSELREQGKRVRCKRGVRVGGESEVQEQGDSVRCDSRVRCESVR